MRFMPRDPWGTSNTHRPGPGKSDFEHGLFVKGKHAEAHAVKVKARQESKFRAAKAKKAAAASARKGKK